MKTAGTILAMVGSAAMIELSFAPVAIPYVATRSDAVRDMLWMANVGTNDVVYDLGSGDGRIVLAAVRDFGARRAVGIEIDAERVRESRKQAEQAGVSDRVEFIQGDLFTNDIREASVVTLFLGHEPNLKLRPKLLGTLKPGTRIVSHQFGMGEWPPDKSMTVRTVTLGMWGEGWNPYKDNPRVPDYTGNEPHYGRGDMISMWVVPACVGGIWRGTIETVRGAQECRLVLHQRLSVVTGTFELAGQSNLTELVKCDLWGEHVRFEASSANRASGQFQVKFDGHVHDNTMRGALEVVERGQPQEHPWTAQRDEADFTGTWEWPRATGLGSVRMRIGQRDGHLTGTYMDEERTVPLTDLYDCGGGFYFTLLVGREGRTISGAEDTGWLIGEGLLEQGALKGTIEFYPYLPRLPAATNVWAPRLMKP
jgi:hypothetical protein